MRLSALPLVVALALLGCAAGARPARVEAIPYFAHEYGVRCQTCHTVIPHLGPVGEAFRANGFAFPGARPARVVPVAVKINLAYASEPDPTGLPKATLDEVELFVAGRIGSRAHYFVEQYAIDGGRHGKVRDAWIDLHATPRGARVPVDVQAGQFTLPLPVDPESFRETLAHYTLYDQRVGANPFAFFDTKIGGGVRVGNDAAGTSVALLAFGGHDPQSGIDAHGTDTMIAAQHVLGPLTLAAYRYAGARPAFGGLDHFWRFGYGATARSGPFEAAAVLQTGDDARVDARDTGTVSSGGFASLRYAATPRLFALVRYEGTNDATNGFTRDAIGLVGYRTSHNARVTVEDDVAHVPRTKHTLGMQYTVAY